MPQRRGFERSMGPDWLSVNMVDLVWGLVGWALVGWALVGFFGLLGRVYLLYWLWRGVTRRALAGILIGVLSVATGVAANGLD